MSDAGKRLLSILVVAAGVFFLFGGANQRAEAQAYSHISNVKWVAKTPYVRNSWAGNTYNFTSTTGKFKFSRLTHRLRNYPNTTWNVTRRATVTKPNGVRYTYYYVTNGHGDVSGWIWHGYLKKKSIVPNLSAAEASARSWIVARESGGSYTARNGVCYGKYQLNLGYLHGNLSPENQEKMAQKYVTSRYGSWRRAKSFWQSHHWY